MRDRWKTLCLSALATVTVAGCAGLSAPSASVTADRGAVNPPVLSRPSTVGRLPGPTVDATSGAGSLWVLTRSKHHRPGRLSRIELSSGHLVYSVPISGPQAIAYGWHSVWVVRFGIGDVVRLDSEGGRRLARIPLRLPHPVSNTPDGRDFVPYDIAAGHGSIWVSTARGSVARIDPRSSRVTEQIDVPPNSVGALAVGEGAIWLAEDLDGIRRVDLGTRRQTTIPITTTDGRPLAITELVVRGGLVYAIGGRPAPAGGGNYVATNKVALAIIDPDSDALPRPTPLPPRAVLAPADSDATWLSSWDSQGLRIVRPGTRPGTAELSSAIPLRKAGHLVAVTDGELWIAETTGRLVRYGIEKSR